MEFLNNFPNQQGVYYLDKANNEFESLYLKIREQEGRLYSDEEVKTLPKLPKGHLQYQEWRWRLNNSQRLLEKLSKQSYHQILDLGCGNGWYTNYLAKASNHSVLGLDINTKELVQAARLFKSIHCHFAFGNVFVIPLPLRYFNRIILNSSIQYFSNLEDLLQRLLTLLNDDGEIHILDSPIYRVDQLKDAKLRTKQYYASQGVAEMAQHYHHHTWEDISGFKPIIRYHPEAMKAKLSRKLLKKGSPFPWISIKAE